MQHESDMVTYPSCKRLTIEIDHYGERLVGCIECNRWSGRGSNRLFMELPEQDLAALHTGLMQRETDDS